jgi:hypothetical protein
MLSAEPAVQTGQLEPDHPLVEWSGLAACHNGKGTWWALNDGGNPADLILLDKHLTVLAKVPIAVANTDWEDLAYAHGSIFIADIGDNARKRPHLTVHSFQEPSAFEQAIPPEHSWTLRYPEEKFDAEAFVVIERSGWIIDKRIAEARLWSFDLDGPAEQVLQLAGTVPLLGPILGADYDATGKRLVVSYPMGIHLIPLAHQSLTSIDFNTATSFYLPLSAQREAVAFSADAAAVLCADERKHWWQIPLHP